MELRDVRIEESPAGKERVRLRADVHYEVGPVASEEYWFDVPRAHEAEIAISGNPWVACLLPLAAHSGEPLRVPLPVDKPLLINAERLMRIWRSWYPSLAVASIEADAVECGPRAQPSRVGAFFSGGVDSFFTVVRRRDVAPPGEREPIDDLITVWGFDIPLDRGDAFTRLRGRHERIAGELGKQFIDVATNLRSTRWGTAPWSALAHGAGFASVALSLEGRFRRVYVAGSGSYRAPRPWGSHMVTDPLFSSCGTSIVFDAAAFLRTEKIEYLARCPTVLGELRVCYALGSDENCGVCNKCLRTMATLDLCRALDQSRTFPVTRLDLGRLAQMDCSDFADFRELQDIRALALRTNRADVVEAVDRSVARTRRRRWLRAALTSVRRPLRSLRHRLRRDR